MRAARNAAWLVENNKLMGLNLGSDFTAEHEWGIKDLKKSFGINDNDISVYGIEKRRITEVPKSLYYLKTGKTSILTMKDFWQGVPEELTIKLLRSSELYDYNELNTAWDEETFGILVKDKENQVRLEELYLAIQNKDAAIWLGGGGVFENAGLCIAILSALPQENLKTMREADENSHKLSLASEATGIKQKIDEANSKVNGWDKPCGYFALSPRWNTFVSGGAAGKPTKHPVVYWLNPMGQDKNNYGWFTVEELEQWIEGKGPIPKSDVQ